jgi:Mor family transcriptional regulator
MKIKTYILQICEDYNNGMTINDLSIKYSISVDQVITILRQHDLISSE